MRSVYPSEVVTVLNAIIAFNCQIWLGLTSGVSGISGEFKFFAAGKFFL
jgi:hypothetical protein